MNKIISVKNISKNYDSWSLKNINFDIFQGEVITLLGSNGCGKTTILKLLATHTTPDAGTITYLNQNKKITIEKLREKIGVLFEKHTLYNNLTVYENLDFFSTLYGISENKKNAKITTQLIKFNLLKYKNQTIDSLSYGLKRRVDLARAYLNNPDILILDEPFKGLDTNSTEILKQLIIDGKNNKKTTIFSTNIKKEAETIATKIGVFKNNQFKIITNKKN